MRLSTCIAAALALITTAGCDTFNPDARPSLAVSIQTEEPTVGEPVLVVITTADDSGVRELVVDWGDDAEETTNLSGSGVSLELEHVYAAEGAFQIQATVRDDAGQSASTTVTAIVGPAPETAARAP